MRRSVAIVTLCLAVCATGTAYATTTTSAGQVRFENREDNPYAVNLRLLLHPVALYVGTADTLGAYGALEWEPSRTMAVGGSASVPYYHLDRNRGIPNDYFQAEAWVRFNFVDRLRGTQVRLTLHEYASNYQQTSDGTSWTQHEIYVNAPATVREFRGMRLGAQYLQLPAVDDTDETCRTECRWNATRIVGFLGYYGGTSTNRSIWFDGYGERNSRVRAAWFVEGLIAPSIEYEPFDGHSTADSQTPGAWDWGFRLGFESSAGIPAGGGVRGEIGLNPHGGWYGVVSVGLDLNLSVGGGHERPKS